MLISEELKELQEIKAIASFINEETKNISQEAINLAHEFEKMLNFAPEQMDLSAMNQRYLKKDEMYYLGDIGSEEGYKQILTTGAVPVNDQIKIKLNIIENLYPKISAIYRKYKYVDEVWYLDKQSVAGGNTEKNVLSSIKPGFDIGGEYERGEKPYSRFGIIGPEQNPARDCLWSPDAFIELFDEFVISAQAPVYIKNEMVGKISIHYNLIYLRNDTIDKTQQNLILLSNHYTLIGLSPSARAITHFPQYEKKNWDSKKAKIAYVTNELNLVKLNKDFTDKLELIKPGIPGECYFSGKRYHIFKEEIPEIGFQLFLLL